MTAPLPAYDAGPELGLIDRTHIGQAELDLLDEVIAYLEGTEEESWWPGPTYRSPCGTQHCALSHVEARWDMETMGEFESTWSNSYVIGSVNDGGNRYYRQATPKARCLAYLHALRRGDEPDMTTSMEASSRHSLLGDATRQPLDTAAAQARATQLSHPVTAHQPVAEAIAHWSANEPARALTATRAAGISDEHAFEILYTAIRASHRAAA